MTTHCTGSDAVDFFGVETETLSARIIAATLEPLKPMSRNIVDMATSYSRIPREYPDNTIVRAESPGRSVQS
jgi:hypothetical protein